MSVESDRNEINKIIKLTIIIIVKKIYNLFICIFPYGDFKTILTVERDVMPQWITLTRLDLQIEISSNPLFTFDAS